ncbi:iron-sulfur cluster repair di-iron protein [Anaerocolumna sp. MB42-C2]|uniref:iron-sulfur cluster repair di-iron protein n=1 Tax=Anaerocolumna sp. MB42-C2 TaxID=3070997 RepID=UPI0027E0197C|nr:iron-sulfur cluster repair di-iron protein [Anaerocolumna sp. MB42-C2]WMJ89881.1 iron-sulfur cluster repair di-iron protein [Anaerocolumna sp. MB42-C2]
MNYMDKNICIGDVVAAIPGATKVFDEFGIDYCCGGFRSLSEVIKNQGIDETKVYEKIGQTMADRQNDYQGSNFNEMSKVVLSAYIEDTHHSYLRKALPEVSELLNTIVRVHGKNHRELYDVYKLFGKLKTDLEQHLIKEETLLFPVLDQVLENEKEVLSLTGEIVTEHEAAGEILRELRNVSGDYHLPEDVCNTYRKAYSLLIELEQDLHQHIHLENNILLKQYVSR